MKRRAHCMYEDASGGAALTKESTLRCAEPLYAAPALPRPSWACLAQELGPARLLAAVVCTHTLAVVSLQVVDKALSASAPAMATLQSSAVAAATALFAAHLREASLPPINPHWVAPTPAAQSVLARLLAALVTDMQGTAASAPVGGFVSAGYGLVASADAHHLRSSLERAQRAWNHTTYSILRLDAAAATAAAAAAAAPAPTSSWGAVSALMAGKVGLGAAANILLPRSQSSGSSSSSSGSGAASPAAAAAAAPAAWPGSAAPDASLTPLTAAAAALRAPLPPPPAAPAFPFPVASGAWGGSGSGGFALAGSLCTPAGALSTLPLQASPAASPLGFAPSSAQHSAAFSGFGSAGGSGGGGGFGGGGFGGGGSGSSGGFVFASAGALGGAGASAGGGGGGGGGGHADGMVDGMGNGV